MFFMCFCLPTLSFRQSRLGYRLLQPICLPHRRQLYQSKLIHCNCQHTFLVFSKPFRLSQNKTHYFLQRTKQKSISFVACAQLYCAHLEGVHSCASRSAQSNAPSLRQHGNFLMINQLFYLIYILYLINTFRDY